MSFEPVHQEDINLKQFLEKNGYWNIRFLPDGVVCNQRLIFTTALLIGVDYNSWERRFCYEDHVLAERACLAMNSVDDEPLAGWVAKR